jgi:hypothetical protein
MAVSFSNDDEARNLAKRYGATALLDKMNLYHELVPAIMQSSHTTHTDHNSPKAGNAQATQMVDHFF